MIVRTTVQDTMIRAIVGLIAGLTGLWNAKYLIATTTDMATTVAILANRVLTVAMSAQEIQEITIGQAIAGLMAKDRATIDLATTGMAMIGHGPVHHKIVRTHDLERRQKDALHKHVLHLPIAPIAIELVMKVLVLSAPTKATNAQPIQGQDLQEEVPQAQPGHNQEVQGAHILHAQVQSLWESKSLLIKAKALTVGNQDQIIGCLDPKMPHLCQ